jgi:hypothetical protein
MNEIDRNGFEIIPEVGMRKRRRTAAVQDLSENLNAWMSR